MSKRSKVKSKISSFISFIVVIALIFGMYKVVVFPIRVQGESMMNTLHDQDLGIMNKWLVKVNGVERFDVVVIYSRELDEDIIKRIIGLPGEKIEYRDDMLYINGEYVPEPFLDETFMNEEKKVFEAELFTDDFSITLDDDEYFAMGDNRLNSMDSRALGAFKMKDIAAKNGYIIFPFDQIGPLE